MTTKFNNELKKNNIEGVAIETARQRIEYTLYK